ncbi:unnamed protein product, partial [marine sediment metagenome]
DKKFYRQYRTVLLNRVAQTILYRMLKCYTSVKRDELMQNCVNAIKRSKKYTGIIRLAKSGELVKYWQDIVDIIWLASINPLERFFLPTRFYNDDSNRRNGFESVCLPGNLDVIISLDSSVLSKDLYWKSQAERNKYHSLGYKFSILDTSELDANDYYSHAGTVLDTSNTYKCLKQRSELSCDKCKRGCYSPDNNKLIIFKYHR